MADVYDFFLAIDLRDDFSDQELAELRWHLGLGPRPADLTILTGFATSDPEDDSPFPVLAGRGAGARISGALFSVLEPRPNGWALTTRQELHPDEYEEVNEFLTWLGTKADYDYRAADGTTKGGGFGQFVGYERFYEDARIEKHLVIDDFRILRSDP